MIKNKAEYYYYLEADRIALSRPNSAETTLGYKIKLLLFPDYIHQFQKTLRKLEYLNRKKKNILEWIVYFFALRKYYRLSYKLSFTIPVNVFGPGLSIAHHGTIIINPGTRIGSNCRLHADVVIATQTGYSDRAPKFGDNIYIGSGAKIFGQINIPNNTAIGANSVVNKSFELENTVLGGVPATVLGTNVDIDDFIIQATSIIDSGKNKLKLSGKPSKEVKRILNS